MGERTPTGGEDVAEPGAAEAAKGRPQYLVDLEAIFGGPSAAGFGSAVFHRSVDAAAPLEEVSREVYRGFVGELWERYGEEAWLGPWRRAHQRGEGVADIVAELRGLEGPRLRSSASLVLDSPEPAAAVEALVAAFDDEAVSELSIFEIGDGEAMSGLLVAGRRAADAIFLAVLMD